MSRIIYCIIKDAESFWVTGMTGSHYNKDLCQDLKNWKKIIEVNKWRTSDLAKSVHLLVMRSKPAEL